MKKAALGRELSNREQQLIAYNVFEGKMVAKLLSGALTEEEGIKRADFFIQNNSEISDKTLVERIREMIIQVIISQNESSDLSRRYIEYFGKLK